ncbi:hypothetical protein Tco_0578786 [Tanacetum coccineum]
MRTRSQSRNSNRQQQVNPTFVEPFNLVEPIENQPIPVVTMDDTRTMAQLLEAPTVGYEDAIVVPEITADNFELKHGLLTLFKDKTILIEHDKEDPHAHIRYFNKITFSMKFPSVPNTSVKLMLFPFSLEGTTRIWLEKKIPSIDSSHDDLVSKIQSSNFSFLPKQQIFEMKSRDFNKDLMKLSTRHGTDSMILFEHAHIMDFRELHHSILSHKDLKSNDQDSLNSQQV